MYTRKSRLSSYKQSRLIEHFVAGTIARAAAQIIGVQANTSITFCMRLLKLIAGKLPSYELQGEVEADESYLVVFAKANEVEGLQVTSAVLGLLKRSGKVYTAIIANAKTKALLPIIEQKVKSILFIPILSKHTML